MSRKLGEALARRNELQTRVAEIRDRLRIGALVQEGDSPPEDPEPLLRELDQVAGELETLIASINRTNAQARYSRSEIRLVRTFDVGAIRARIDQLARQRRELDVEIQTANWTVDLDED